MLRRLEKRILVGLPSAPARQAMISHWLPPVSNTSAVELRTELDYNMLAQVKLEDGLMEECELCKPHCAVTQILQTQQTYTSIWLSVALNRFIFQETEGYSGSDIRLVCKEAAMRPVRKIFDALENHIDGKKCFTSSSEQHQTAVSSQQFLAIIHPLCYAVYLHRSVQHAGY